MNDAIARAARLTRRSFGASLIVLIGIAAAETWPRWAFWRAPPPDLSPLAARGDAAPLRVLGARFLAAAPQAKADLAAQLAERLADGGYDAAIARDRAAGRLVAIDGWLVPETQALAAGWLASA